MDPNPVEPDIPTLLTTNAVPGYFASSYIRRTLDQIESDIARTYGTAFYSSREKALATRKTLQSAKKNYRGILSAVRKVTDDVWARIFRFNAGEPGELTRYRRVSRSWFNATRHPSLRTDVNIRLYHDQEFDRVRVDNLEDILDHLTYVRPFLLDLNIRYDLPAYAFDIGRCDVELLPDKSTWRSLTTGPGLLRVIMCPDSGFSFESLKEVVVRSATGLEDDGDVEGVWMVNLPSLSRLTMKVKSGVSIESIAVSWHQLTHLSVDAKYSDASDYLEILFECRNNLKSCEMRLNRSPYPPRVLPFRLRNRLNMGKMRKFRLMGRECPALFLSFLLMPALEMLEIGWDEEDIRAKSSPPSLSEESGMGPGPGKRIADFVEASECRIESFWMQAKDVWFSDVGEALAAMRESLREVTLLISNFPSMPAIDRELDIATQLDAEGDVGVGMADEDEPSALHHQLLLPHLEEFTIHSSFFAIPLEWFMAFVQPITLTIGEPEEIEFYREEDCVSFIYEDRALTVCSGYEGLTKDMVSAEIAGRYEVEILV